MQDAYEIFKFRTPLQMALLKSCNVDMSVDETRKKLQKDTQKILAAIIDDISKNPTVCEDEDLDKRHKMTNYAWTYI